MLSPPPATQAPAHLGIEGFWRLQHEQQLRVVNLQQHARDLASQLGVDVVDEGIETLTCMEQPLMAYAHTWLMPQHPGGAAVEWSSDISRWLPRTAPPRLCYLILPGASFPDHDVGIVIVNAALEASLQNQL